MKTSIYNVDSPVKFGGDQYHPDNEEMNTIELSVKDAKDLLAVNAISAPGESEEAPTSDNKNVVQLNKAPKEKADRIVAIKEAIELLDKDDEAHWTKNKEPDANVLTELLGWKVKAAERNQAWMEVLEAEGKG